MISHLWVSTEVGLGSVGGREISGQFEFWMGRRDDDRGRGEHLGHVHVDAHGDRGLGPGVQPDRVPAESDPDEAEAVGRNVGQDGRVPAQGVCSDRGVVVTPAAKDPGQPGGEPAEAATGDGADRNRQHQRGARTLGDRCSEAEGGDETTDHGAGEDVAGQSLERAAEQVTEDERDRQQGEADHPDHQERRHAQGSGVEGWPSRAGEVGQRCSIRDDDNVARCVSGCRAGGHPFATTLLELLKQAWRLGRGASAP